MSNRSASRPQLSVAELLRHTLPLGTRVAAGRAGLARPVAWVSVMQTRPPAFPSMERHELALLTMDALGLLSDKLTLAALLGELAQMDVAAVGVIGNIDTAARRAADELQLPLLSLPPDQRGREVHEQLLQLSTENRGLRALIAALADTTGHTLVVQDKRMDVVATAGALAEAAQGTLTDGGESGWAALETVLRSEESLPPHFRNRVEVAQAALEPAVIAMPELAVQRLTLPIIANRLGRGFFSLVARADDAAFDALDFQFARHGAAVCALEMAKEKAIREAQKRVQGGVLERLLIGSIPVDQALRQLVRLGHQPNGQGYAAMTAAWALEDAPSDRRLETIFNEQVAALGIEALVQLLEGGVVVFCAVEGGPNSSARAVPRSARQLADSVQTRVRAQFPAANVAVGIGRPVQNLAEWRGSYQEALAAQRIALQWRRYQPLYFADLGVYRLLSLLLESVELRSFFRETLGGLAEEAHMNDEFVLTLEAFFEAHGNLSQTANSLHVHRNTLLYRMERIAQIGGFDLDNPETRLAVHLALKIRRLLAEPK